MIGSKKRSMPIIILERTAGIKPASARWQRATLSLSYVRVVGEAGLEPAKAKPTDLQSVLVAA